MKQYDIAVAGTGYVGLSIATLLAQHNHVTAVDVIPEKVEAINRRKSPIQDEYIEKYLAEKDLDLRATLDGAEAYRGADFIVIAAPTNYDPVKNYFDTSHVEEVIDLVLEVNPDAVMVIKSTIPVGYCRSLYMKYAAKGVKQFNLLSFCRAVERLYHMRHDHIRFSRHGGNKHHASGGRHSDVHLHGMGGSAFVLPQRDDKRRHAEITHFRHCGLHCEMGGSAADSDSAGQPVHLTGQNCEGREYHESTVLPSG